jgi:hypothetical protein
MKIICLSVTLFFLAGVCTGISPAQFELIENTEKGVLTVREGPALVLSYRFGDQLPSGVAPEQVRSCYIHPLFSLDGKVLTADFPEDHLHHHGIFWTWPVVKTRGRDTQTWHPHTPSLRQHFVRWLEREVKGDRVVLRLENVWKLAGEEIVAREFVTLLIHSAQTSSRALDVEIELQAVGGPLTLQGTPEGNKGYGGLCLRGAELFTGARLFTDKGVLDKDSTNVPFRWADLSSADAGVAIFVSPRHPGYPPTWLIRNSYAGVLNVSWPGLEPRKIEDGDIVLLAYRVYVHRGDIDKGRIHQAYQRYLAEFK